MHRGKQEQEFYIRTQELADMEFYTEEEERVAFGAFCILSNVARRSFDRTKGTDLINGYRQKFGNHVFFRHLRLLGMLDNHVGLDHEEILNLAFENSKNKDYALRVGRYQMYAQTINNRLHNEFTFGQLQQ